MPETKEKEEERPVVAKTAVDLQRLKLQKLMKNPEKPIILPERPKTKNTPSVPEFVRNVMGSSAGAGSGEFHVYRHLRRKEYARQKFIQEKGHKELLDEAYHRKIEENRRIAEETTAKRRAKRLKKKQKWKQKKKIGIKNETKDKKNEETNSDDESSDEEKISDKTDEQVKEMPCIENENNRFQGEADLKPNLDDTCKNGNKLHLETNHLKQSDSLITIDNDKDNGKEICVNTNNLVC